MKHIYNYLLALSTMFIAATSSAQQATTPSGVELQEIEMLRSGDRLIVEMTMDISQLHVRPNRSLRLMPIVTNGNEIVQLPAVIIDGRRRHIVHERQKSDMYESINTYIRRHNRKEQIEQYEVNLPFESWMTNSELVLQEEWCGCHDIPLSGDMMAIAALQKPTPARPDLTQQKPQATYIMPEPKPTQAIELQEFDIFFPLNKSQISDTFMDNSAQIKNLHAALAEGNIKAIHLMGYASPDGPYNFNHSLAAKRADAVHKHLASANLPSDINIVTGSDATNWNELKKMLSDNKITNWQQIISVIDDSSIPAAEKNNAIRTRFPDQYALMLKNWYPQLRVTDIKVEHKPQQQLTVADAKRIVKENPQQLSLDDIYLIAIRYGKGSKEWDELILLAVESYPQSVEARINAANVAMANGDYSQAATYLQGLSDNIPEAANSKGILAMAEGRYDQAMTLFQKAQSGGVSEAAYNISLLKQLMNSQQ